MVIDPVLMTAFSGHDMSSGIGEHRYHGPGGT